MLAIGAALSLTLLFEGFRLGLDWQMAAPASALAVPLVALEAGARHFVGLRSDLPQAARTEVESVVGVREAHPLVVVPVIFERDGNRTPLQLLAYDSAGEPRLAAGRPIDGPHQIVLDERLADRYRLRIGDPIELLERDLRVVGLSRGTDVSFAPFAFVKYDELLDLYLETDVPGALGGAPLLSFLLLELEPGAQAAAVRAAIESQVADADVYTPAELAAEDVRFGRQLFGPVLDLLVAMGWIAAVLAVGLIMAAAVVDRHRELGIAKALGAAPVTLAAAVLIEAVLVSLLAFAPGLLLALGAAAAVERIEPLYRVIAWDPVVLARGGVAALMAALAGALMPLRRLAAVDPGVVFRS